MFILRLSKFLCLCRGNLSQKRCICFNASLKSLTGFTRPTMSKPTSQRLMPLYRNSPTGQAYALLTLAAHGVVFHVLEEIGFIGFADRHLSFHLVKKKLVTIHGIDLLHVDDVGLMYPDEMSR